MRTWQPVKVKTAPSGFFDVQVGSFSFSRWAAECPSSSVIKPLSMTLSIGWGKHFIGITWHVDAFRGKLE